MTAAASEVVPQPHLIDCAVTIVSASRTLIVQPAATGEYGGLAFREAWQALLSAEQSGWRDSLSVWASFAGFELVTVHSAADPDRPVLRFSFQVGDLDYENLVYKRGLFAIATIDVNSHRFLAVRFGHRP